jgi:hypothetical protein
MGRLRWLALAAPLLAACAPPRMSTEARIARVDAALGGTSGSVSKYLRYASASDAGAWTREIVVTPGAYAERRTRSDGTTYAFGRDEAGGWLRIGEGAVIDASGSMWEQEARTGAGLFGLRFAQPAGDDEATYMGRNRTAWELAFRPEGGRTLTFAIDRASSKPNAYDVVDDFGRLVSCDDLAFEPGAGGPVLASWRCATNDRFGFAGQVLEEHGRLEEERAVDLGSVPRWVRPDARRATPPSLERPVEVHITDARRIEVPARFNDRAPVPLILDTGAFFTILSRRAADALGVVPTGETRLHVDPPWLQRSHLWVGVVEKLSLAGADLYGERVLVAESQDFGAAAGLLGRSTLRRFIVDVDSPRRTLRLHKRAGFRPDRGFRPVQLWGSSIPMIEGEVVGVAEGLLLLDTGMEEDIVVHALEMKIKHPRERGSGVALGGPDDGRESPDYASRIDGLRFGPFSLPKMDALGRDRDQRMIGAGVAIVGMGVMRYFRLAFDLRNDRLYAWPGNGYRTLRHAGIDLEEGSEGTTVDRVLEGGPGEAAGLRRGDVILSVDGDYRAQREVDVARDALGLAPAGAITVWVIRKGAPKKLELMLPSLGR